MVYFTVITVIYINLFTMSLLRVSDFHALHTYSLLNEGVLEDIIFTCSFKLFSPLSQALMDLAVAYPNWILTLQWY